MVKNLEKNIFYFLGVMFVVSLAIALIPNASKQVKHFLAPEIARVVLSTASARLLGDQQLFTVVKVKTPNGLFIEIYRQEDSGLSSRLEAIPLNQVRDGYLHYDGQALNLLVKDITGDGRPEIIAPSFDKDLVPQLHVYAYRGELEASQALF